LTNKFCTFYQKQCKIAEANPIVVDSTARATIRAQTQTAISLNISVLSGIKPYTITAEQCIQRVDNAVATGGRTNAETIGFVTTLRQESALKWYGA
jgi:hypothetical protein